MRRALPIQTRRLAAAAFPVLVAAGTAFGQASFRVLRPVTNGYWTIPNGISADGSVIAGTCYISSILHALRWTPTTVQDLGGLTTPGTGVANGISADGLTIVGRSQSFSINRGIRWTASFGMEDLDPDRTYGNTWANTASSNGSVIVGAAAPPIVGESFAFRWTAPGGIVNLGNLQGGYASFANAVSTSGAVVVGHSTTSSFTHACRWTTPGSAQDLGAPPGCTFSSATAISGDGAVIVGYGSPGSATANTAFKWTSPGGLQVLPGLAGSTSTGASTISADGSIIGGYSVVGGTRFAVQWTSQGLARLIDTLAPYGIVPAGWTLEEVRALSGNARVIAGSGRLNGAPMGFVVSLPAVTCYANCDGSTALPILNVADFVCFQSRYAAGSPYANCDNSTTPPVLNVGDFVCFQSRYAAGCP